MDRAANGPIFNTPVMHNDDWIENMLRDNNTLDMCSKLAVVRDGLLIAKNIDENSNMNLRSDVIFDYDNL